MGKPAFLYESRLKDAAPVASSTAAGAFDPANLADWQPFTWWKPAAMPATVRVDCGLASAANYWAVWGHDLGSQGATIVLHKSPGGTWAGADDIIVDSFTPADDEPFARFVTTADSQHWGFEVTGAAAPSLAIVAMGELLELPEYLEQGFDPLGREPQGQLNRAVRGNPLGRTVDYELWEQAIDLRRLNQSWVRNSFLPAWNAHLRDDPFIFAWDRINQPEDLKLATVAGGLGTPHFKGGKADFTIRLEAAV